MVALTERRRPAGVRTPPPIIMLMLSVLLLLASGAMSIEESTTTETGTETSPHRNKGYFWQVTDIHYDLQYSEQGDPLARCHAINSSDDEPHPGKFGNHLCDSPWVLADSAVQTMRQHHPKPDFIIWTGDTSPHLNGSSLINNITIYNVTTLLRDTFPETLILPTIGNHDSFPGNEVPVAPSAYYTSLLNHVQWGRMLPNTTWSSFLKGGFYKVSINPGLWMIGLNTILWYTRDTQADGLPDPDGQLHWLEEQLAQARKDKHKVLLSGHVPPGVMDVPWYYPSTSSRLLDILKKYHDVIPATFFAHEHRDNYRIVYDDQGDAVVPIFLAPAVVPFTSDPVNRGANNPSIRLYEYDRATGEVLDILQYYLNMTEANIAGEARWLLEYQFTQAYTLPDLSPLSLHVLAESFKEQDSDSFEQYMNYYYVSYDPLKCDGACKTKQICSITAVDYNRHEECLQSTSEMLDYEVLEGDEIIPHDDLRPRPIPPKPHPPSPPRKPVPDYMYVVIYCMVVVVILMFIGITLYCCCREPRRVAYFSQPRYVLIT